MGASSSIINNNTDRVEIDPVSSLNSYVYVDEYIFVITLEYIYDDDAIYLH